MDSVDLNNINNPHEIPSNKIIEDDIELSVSKCEPNTLSNLLSDKNAVVSLTSPKITDLDDEEHSKCSTNAVTKAVEVTVNGTVSISESLKETNVANSLNESISKCEPSVLLCNKNEDESLVSPKFTDPDGEENSKRSTIVVNGTNEILQEPMREECVGNSFKVTSSVSVDSVRKKPVLSDEWIAELLSVKSEHGQSDTEIDLNNSKTTSNCKISIVSSEIVETNDELADVMDCEQNNMSSELPENVNNCNDKASFVVDKQTYREESDSSSDESDSSSSSSADEDSESSDSSLDFMNKSNKPTEKKKQVCTVKTKGELGLEDLPPIEELCISVLEKESELIGKVHSIVEQLVVVRAMKGLAPIDLDSVLFLSHSRPLGRVFDVFGQVAEPFYSVRFNSAEDIKSQCIKIGMEVYYAPGRSDVTKFVFVDELKCQKGSDASWANNNEPPDELIMELNVATTTPKLYFSTNSYQYIVTKHEHKIKETQTELDQGKLGYIADQFIKPRTKIMQIHSWNTPFTDITSNYIFKSNTGIHLASKKVTKGVTKVKNGKFHALTSTFPPLRIWIANKTTYEHFLTTNCNNIDLDKHQKHFSQIELQANQTYIIQQGNYYFFINPHATVFQLRTLDFKELENFKMKNCNTITLQPPISIDNKKKSKVLKRKLKQNKTTPRAPSPHLFARGPSTSQKYPEHEMNLPQISPLLLQIAPNLPPPIHASPNYNDPIEQDPPTPIDQAPPIMFYNADLPVNNIPVRQEAPSPVEQQPLFAPIEQQPLHAPVPQQPLFAPVEQQLIFDPVTQQFYLIPFEYFNGQAPPPNELQVPNQEPPVVEQQPILPPVLVEPENFEMDFDLDLLDQEMFDIPRMAEPQVPNQEPPANLQDEPPAEMNPQEEPPPVPNQEEPPPVPNQEHPVDVPQQPMLFHNCHFHFQNLHVNYNQK